MRKISAECDGRGGPGNAPFLCDPLPYTRPTCEVLYLEGAIPRIIFRTSHGVMDGIGTLTWMEDVFRVLRSENPIGSSSTLTEYLLASSISDKTKKMHPADTIAPTGKAGKNINGTTWKRLTFDGTHTKLLGRIGMAIAGSAWKYGRGPVRIGIPVDVRPRIAGLRSTGNLSMALNVEISKKSTADSITYDIIRQLYNQHDCICVEGGDYLDLVPLWLMGIGVKLITKIIHAAGRYNFSCMISNHGKIDLDKFSGGGFSADTIFFIPPRVDWLPSFVILAGNEERLEVTVSVPHSLG
ncbi:MAG: hypothetical protein JW807_05180 [Spirochaetes bacterium]|nr:hypothetical protein [Spirochaetota bacterium]